MALESDEDNLFEEVSEYSKIEQHMIFSKTLHQLKGKGKNILKEFDEKKFDRQTKKRKNVFIGNTSIIYSNIANIIAKSKYSLQLGMSLQFYLDELMFNEIKNIQTFVIEDQDYDLTKLYYHPTEWIQDNDLQIFNFYAETDININESMYLVCYLKEYENFLLEIEDYLKNFKDKYSIKKKLLKLINRIRLKFKIIWEIIINIISDKVEKFD